MPTQPTRPNGINTNYNYDNLSHLLSVLHQLNGATLDGASYTSDAAGNRTSKTNHLNNTTENYAYDAIYQLQQVTQGSSTKENYTYDLVGNRLSSLGVSPYNYNTSNHLTSTPSASYGYDANGSTTSKADATGTTTYNWDPENRLSSVILPGTGGTVSFMYDPFGRRIQKAGPLGTTNYLYDGIRASANIIEEVDGSGNVLARYSATRRVDDQLSEFRSGVSSYYEADGLGSVTSLSNGVGALANTYTYDSFGKLTAYTGTLTNPFQYTGREFDPETGSDFYRARYYDQSVGRFFSEDPIRFKAGINFYAYVNNSPTTYKDPLGLLRDCDAEHNECVRDCMSKPTGCLPWPVGRSGSPAARRWSRYAYCTAKCLAEYMECVAANEAQQIAEYCNAHPATCAAYATAIPIVILQPELAPILF